ncbi:DNA-binding protein, partial [Parabacteroides sp. TM07-1AC]
FKEMLRKVSIQKFDIPETDETGGSGGNGEDDRPVIE